MPSARMGETLARSEPVQQRGAREAPVVAELATRQLARLGELGHHLGLDLQQRGGLLERQDLLRLGGAEVRAADHDYVNGGIEEKEWFASTATNVISTAVCAVEMTFVGSGRAEPHPYPDAVDVRWSWG